MMEAMWTGTDRFQARNRLTYARLLMVGATLGAMLALTSTFVFSAPFEPEAPAPEQPHPGAGGEPDGDGTHVPAEFSAHPGSCVAWSAGDARDMETVQCDEPHQFQVTAVIDVSTDYPDSSPPPDLEEWQDIVDERCTGPADEYMEGGLDPSGKFQVSAIFPNETDWEAGQRKVHCGLWRPAPGGELQDLTDSVASQDQSDVWEEGTCLALDDKAVGDPIDCSEPHAYEMIAVVDLSEEFDDYPSEDEQMEWLDTVCADRADDYTGGEDLEDNDLIVAWDTREEASWDAGSHLVNCKVGAVLDDGSGLAPVTGSVAEDSEEGEDAESDEDGESGDE
ncbi:Septum formation [Haloechinothrix alba]|uniref:Septum formation n=1 Tax=Haloechinothrix alba TaxID=664784 RepID=A0A238V3Z3_9PSEU|nr:septum formation family protein [Haloechinothrix alba]SNR28911.1 Septum formation [Haloechinothrix alba]